MEAPTAPAPSPAHRAAIPSALPSRRRRSARPLRSRSSRRITLTTTIAALGICLVVGPDFVGRVLPDQLGATVPADNPLLGLVYQDLTPAAHSSDCRGGFTLHDKRDTCTTGPEPAPRGLVVSRDVAPVSDSAPTPALPGRDDQPGPTDRALLRETGAHTASANGPALAAEQPDDDSYQQTERTGLACQGDGRLGSRVQVLYAVESGTGSRFSRYAASIRRWAGTVDDMVSASAGRSADRRIRYVTGGDCTLDVAEVELPAQSLASLTATTTALRQRGYDRTDRKYLIFADSRVYCGIATTDSDDRPGASNRNNRGPSYARVDAGCWGASVAARELLRTLGAGQRVRTDDPAGCDAGDLLCPAADSPPTRCGALLDCGGDDYFNTRPAKGSYLATHWNSAGSAFLITGDQVTTVEPKPATPATPKPQPTEPPASPSPSPQPPVELPPPPPGPAPSPTAGPATTSGGTTEPASTGLAPGSTGGAATTAAGAGAPAPTASASTVAARPLRDLDTTTLTPTSLRLRWQPDRPRTSYAVEVDGRLIGATVDSHVRLIGLRPDTRYRIRVLVAGDPYTRRATAQTDAAPRPVGSTTMVNALTGAAMSVAGGRLAAGTPAVLAPADNAPAGDWQLRPAPGDTVTVTSMDTGGCLTLRGGARVGTPVVQAVCSDQDPAQRWQWRSTAAGWRLQPAGSALVVGVSRLHFGEQRIVVLQSASQDRSQAWLTDGGE